MNVSIFGLGYVGCVGIGCLASKGHNLIGVDVSKEKVNLISQGIPTIVEKDIDGLINEGHSSGRIQSTTDYVYAVQNTDISFICVGTPSSSNGHLNLSYILETAKQIGKALKDKNRFHIVVIRSTVFPGTNKRISDIIEEVSGKEVNKDFAVVSNPEFLREGTAVNDYFNPPLTVIGSESKEAIATMQELYKDTNAPIEVVSIGVAEMIKYVNNSYHALKVVFGNEVGQICKELGIDSHEVMRIFCMDKQLNISPYYFRPGFSYGGSCLPKDLKGLQTLAHDLYLDTPVLNSIDKSNRNLIERVIRYLESQNKQNIGFLGLSFKAGTDDMRNSPIMEVIEHFIGKGYDIKIFDENVVVSRLIGKNKSVIMDKLPHLNSLLVENLDEISDWAEILVIANKEPKFKELKPKKNQVLLDLVRIKELEDSSGYHGLSW